jgi:Flp pilus assembly pilin Flp
MTESTYIQGHRIVSFETYHHLREWFALRQKSRTQLSHDTAGAKTIESTLIAGVVSIIIVLLLGDQVLALYQESTATFC